MGGSLSAETKTLIELLKQPYFIHPFVHAEKHFKDIDVLARFTDSASKTEKCILSHLLTLTLKEAHEEPNKDTKKDEDSPTTSASKLWFFLLEKLLESEKAKFDAKKKNRAKLFNPFTTKLPSGHGFDCTIAEILIVTTKQQLERPGCNIKAVDKVLFETTEKFLKYVGDRGVKDEEFPRSALTYVVGLQSKAAMAPRRCGTFLQYCFKIFPDNFEFFKLVLDSANFDHRIKNEYGNSLLHWIAHHGKSAHCQEFLSSGQLQPWMKNMTYEVVDSDDYRKNIRVLLNDEGETPLVLAVKEGAVDVVRDLVTAKVGGGLETSFFDSEAKTELNPMYAATVCDSDDKAVDLVQALLLLPGARDAISRNSDNFWKRKCAAISALSQNHFNLLFLFTANAQFNLPSYPAMCSLHLQLHDTTPGNIDRLNRLLDLFETHGVDMNSIFTGENDKAKNCIDVCCERGRSPEDFKVLIGHLKKHKVDVMKLMSIKNTHTRNFIHLAATHDLCVESLKYLFEACDETQHFPFKELLEGRSCKRTWVLDACEHDLRVETVKFLLDACEKHGADLSLLLEVNETTPSWRKLGRTNNLNPLSCKAFDEKRDQILEANQK